MSNQFSLLNWDLDKCLHAQREEGREEERIEIAKSMLIDEMPLPIISRNTGLSLSDLEIISTEIKNSMND